MYWHIRLLCTLSLLFVLAITARKIVQIYWMGKVIKISNDFYCFKTNYVELKFSTFRVIPSADRCSYFETIYLIFFFWQTTGEIYFLASTFSKSPASKYIQINEIIFLCFPGGLKYWTWHQKNQRVHHYQARTEKSGQNRLRPVVIDNYIHLSDKLIYKLTTL